MRAGLSIAALCSLALVGCEKPPQEPSEAPTILPAENTASSLSPDAIDPSKRARICKEGIAELFQQPTAIMKAEPIAGGITRVSYRRPSDNTLWKNDCRLEGNRIVWRAFDASPGSGPCAATTTMAG